MEKLKNIKIAFVDIDKTLSNNNREITIETSDAIKNAVNNDMVVVLSTGRYSGYAEEYSKKACASCYVIACNGAEIFDYKKREYIFKSKREFDDLKEIWNLCEANQIQCILNSENVRYCNHFYNGKDEDIIKINNIHEVKDKNIYQIVVISNEFTPINEIDNSIDSNSNLQVVNSSSDYINQKTNINNDKNKEHFFLDITNKNINKGIAIDKLLNHLNIPKENSIGFGDHNNDYELFNAVNFKIAMSNATSLLKAKADFITLSNEENGVAHFLNNYISYE